MGSAAVKAELQVPVVLGGEVAKVQAFCTQVKVQIVVLKYSNKS